MLTNYEYYKLQWLIDHEYSLNDLINKLSEIIQQNPSVTLQKTYKQWESEIGFNGEIWDCKEEWEDYEGCGKNADAPYKENEATAKWIKGDRAIYCSHCGGCAYEDSDWGFQEFDYCPNCGAKME